MTSLTAAGLKFACARAWIAAVFVLAALAGPSWADEAPEPPPEAAEVPKAEAAPEAAKPSGPVFQRATPPSGSGGAVEEVPPGTAVNFPVDI